MNDFSEITLTCFLSTTIIQLTKQQRKKILASISLSQAVKIAVLKSANALLLAVHATSYTTNDLPFKEAFRNVLVLLSSSVQPSNKHMILNFSKNF